MEKRERISHITAALMLITAACIELLQLVLNILIIGIFLNPLISFFLAFLFWFWFLILGVSYTQNMKRMLSMFFTALSEMTPFGALPLFTANVFYIIQTARKEDVEHNTQMEQAVAQASQAEATQAEILQAQTEEFVREEEIQAKADEEKAKEEQKPAVNDNTQKVENQIEDIANQSYNKYANDPEFYEQNEKRDAA